MDEHRKMADEHTIGWIKYIDHNGEFPTEMVTCDPDDADAIPICRASSLISTASKSEKDGYRKGVEKAEKFLLDHYWDSIEDKKDLLNLHIKACFKHLIREEGK